MKKRGDMIGMNIEITKTSNIGYSEVEELLKGHECEEGPWPGPSGRYMRVDRSAEIHILQLDKGGGPGPVVCNNYWFDLPVDEEMMESYLAGNTAVANAAISIGYVELAKLVMSKLGLDEWLVTHHIIKAIADEAVELVEAETGHAFAQRQWQGVLMGRKLPEVIVRQRMQSENLRKIDELVPVEWRDTARDIVLRKLAPGRSNYEASSISSWFDLSRLRRATDEMKEALMPFLIVSEARKGIEAQEKALREIGGVKDLSLLAKAMLVAEREHGRGMAR